MSPALSNIEIVSRDICVRLYGRHWKSGPDLDADVNRYWRIVAALLEAGLVVETVAELVPFDADYQTAAIREWRARHPDYVAPLRKVPRHA